MKNDIQIGVRVPADLRDIIRADAERQHRSMADVIRLHLSAIYAEHPAPRGKGASPH